MMEYIKRKLSKMNDNQTWQEKVSYPHYYEENGLLIKEMENGEKFIVTLDKEHKEIIAGKIK